ncbi:MAG: hypothetical protein JWQ50_9416 [Caballeronia mineralivorans]|jgi:hypothetical protein|nr:hypothetical protein [Caballeronia mineralivorans]
MLSDDQYDRIAPLLQGKSTDPGRTAGDNRLFVEAVLWIARTGSGFVNLSRLRRKDGRKKRPSERVGRISGDFGDFAPRNESRRELFAIE